MSTPRLVSAAAAAAALGLTGVADAADAPVVGAQGTLPNVKAPVTFPGTGVHKGERLPSGARVVFRDVTLEDDQEARLTLRAPSGKTLRGVGVREAEHVGFANAGGSYVGKRTVKLRAYLDPRAEGEQTGRVYALTR